MDEPVKSDLSLKVRETISRHGMIPKGSTVYAAVSGGIDSMCMLRILVGLTGEMGFSVIVCHFNHMLRDEESDADESFVGSFCRENSLELLTGRGDVTAFSRISGKGTEESARILRFRFLDQCAAGSGARIATAHHMSDQFETVMFNLLRGAGTAGIAGMRYVSGNIMRPLLDCTKEEIEYYASETGLHYRTDSTNLHAECDRNRMRLNILPAFQQNFGRNIVESVNRTSALCRQDDDFINICAEEIFRSDRNVSGFPVEMIISLHPAVATRLIRLEYRRARGDMMDLEYKHVMIILKYLAGPSGKGSLDLPGGIKAKKCKGSFYMEHAPGGYRT